MAGFWAVIFGLFLIGVGITRKEWIRSPAFGEVQWQMHGQPVTKIVLKPTDKAFSDYAIVWESSKSERAWAAYWERHSDIDFNRRFLGTASTFEEAEKLCLKHKEAMQ